MELMRLIILVLAVSMVWAQDSLSVEWMLLNASTGEPYHQTRFIVGTDTLQTDENGMAQSRHPRYVQMLRPILLNDSLQLLTPRFETDSTFDHQQFVLEIQTRVADKPSDTTTLTRADMVVIAKRDPLHQRKEVSKQDFSRAEMQEMAAIQNDPLQTLRSVPGIAHQNDLNQRPHVRGGDWYETRVFWNGTPVIQPFHATSMYSVFNLEATHDMSFYSGGFPVQGSNSLSGALFLRARPAPLDSFGLWTNLSISKGHFWTGVPVFKDHFGVYFSYQANWYDWFIKRMMDASTLFNDDEEYKDDVEEYKEYVDMPNFKDLQTGFSWQLTPLLRLDYHYLRAYDVFRIVEPEYQTDNLLSGKIKLDTIALVEIPNQIHNMGLYYTVSDRWNMEFNNTLQYVDWNVQFGNRLEGYDPWFLYNKTNIHSRIQNYYQLNSKHLLDFGGSFEKDKTRYRVDMPRFAYEMMMQSNMDMMENLGYYGEKGFTLVEGESNPDWEDLIENVMMDYAGTRTRYTGGIWVSDQWKINDDNRLTLGTRLDWEDVSSSVFLSPRVSWFHRINPKQELTLSTGLYHQDNFEFYYRHLNPNLASEKAVHLNVEWSIDPTPDYRIEWMNYGKYYFDLASAQLQPTPITASQLQNYVLDHFYGNLDELKDTIRGNTNHSTPLTYNELRSYMGESAYQEMLADHDDMTLTYSNHGIGYALGTELRLHYDPTSVWRGWVSGELSMSKRRDTDEGIWYNFRRHRPWSIKWHNYFKMPSNWEFSIRYTHSAGMVYTGYEIIDYDDGAEEGDTVFVVGRKNGRRYSANTRVDFRLEKNYTIWGHPAVSYFEVWNAFNTPNFLLTDNRTGQLKFYDASYPMPIFYSGIEWRW